MPDDCLFCKIIKREIKTEFIYEDDSIVGFKDINPQAPIHFLFIPREHIRSVNDITLDNSDLLGSMLNAIKKVASENNISESGYRIVLNCNKDAGQEVFHLHMHLLGGRKFTWPPG